MKLETPGLYFIGFPPKYNLWLRQTPFEKYILSRNEEGCILTTLWTPDIPINNMISSPSSDYKNESTDYGCYLPRNLILWLELWFGRFDCFGNFSFPKLRLETVENALTRMRRTLTRTGPVHLRTRDNYRYSLVESGVSTARVRAQDIIFLSRE